jgi:hypothetical protein
MSFEIRIETQPLGEFFEIRGFVIAGTYKEPVVVITNYGEPSWYIGQLNHGISHDMAWASAQVECMQKAIARSRELGAP